MILRSAIGLANLKLRTEKKRTICTQLRRLGERSLLQHRLRSEPNHGLDGRLGIVCESQSRDNETFGDAALALASCPGRVL